MSIDLAVEFQMTDFADVQGSIFHFRITKEQYATQINDF